MGPDLFFVCQLVFTVAVIALVVWAVYTGSDRRARLLAGLLVGVVVAVTYGTAPAHAHWVSRTFPIGWLYYLALIGVTGGLHGLWIGLLHGGVAWLVWAWRGGSLLACLAAGVLAGLVGFYVLASLPWGPNRTGVPTWLFVPVWHLFAFVAALAASWLTTRRPQVAPA